MVAGVSLASILGLPFGTFVGQYLGWRFSFGVIAVTSLVVLLFLIGTLPSSPSQNTSLLKSFKSLLKLPIILNYNILLGLVATGHFVAYAYIEHFLKNVGHLNDYFIVIVLLMVGLGGILAGFIYPRWPNSQYQKLKILTLFILFLCLFCLKAFSNYEIAISFQFLIWGTVLTLLAVNLQTEVIATAKDRSDLAIAIFSGVYNIGIGLGAVVGSASQNLFGLGSIGYVGSIFIGISLIYYLLFIKNS